MILLISGCSNKEATTDIIKKDNKLSGIHEISYDDLQQKLASKEKFVLYIGRPDCGDCKEFYPILKNYINDNEGTYVYYLNVKLFRDAAQDPDASKEEKDFFENIQEELSFNWTPTLHFYKGDTILKTYTYLDMEYYELEDGKEQAQVKQDFLDEFDTWMNTIYE
jgi:predicted bacteriocin transport accessory protein